MPKKFLVEFKRGVVTGARRRDLSIAEELVRRRLRQADIDAAVKDSLTSRSRPRL